MNTTALPEQITTSRTTTTLFDLMRAMQQQATTPLDKALIVPTVVDLLRSGRIRLARESTQQAVA